MVDRALFLRDAGYSVLLIDFQATGESPGDVITFGWRERLDVLAAVDFLRRALPGGVGAETLRPIDHAASVACPLLVISGMKDRYTTVDDTRALVEGAGHVDLCRFGGEAYRRRVLAFMASATAAAQAAPARGPAPGRTRS